MRVDNGVPFIYEKDGSQLSLMLDKDTGEYYEFYHYPVDKEGIGHIDEHPADVNGAKLTRVTDDNYDEWISLSLVKESNG